MAGTHEHGYNQPTFVQTADIYILGRKGKDGRQYRPTPDGNFWEYMDEGDETWTVTDVPARGPQGEPLTWGDLTPEQRESLKGEKGDPLTWDDLTPEQKEVLKGDKGDPFIFDDFTPEQLNEITSGLQVNLSQLKPISSGALPTPDGSGITMDVIGGGSGATWTHVSLPSGSASLLKGQSGQFYWDGVSWTLTNVVDLPTSPLSNSVNQDTSVGITPKGVDDAIKNQSLIFDDKISLITDIFGNEQAYIIVNTPVVSPQIISTTAGFFGFGSPIGVVAPFSSIRFNVPTKTVAPSWVKATIRLNSKTGTVLATKTIDVSLPVSTSTNIVTVDFDSIIGTSEKLYFQFECDADVANYAITSDWQFPSATYAISSWKNSVGNWIDDVTQRNIWVQCGFSAIEPVADNTFFDNFNSSSDKFSELVNDIESLNEMTTVIKEIIEEKEPIVTFNPSPGESEGGAMNNPYAIGLLVKDTNVKFNEIELYISGTDNNHTLVLNAYKFDTIPTGSNIMLPASIYTQEFTGGDIAMQNKTTIRLNTIIEASGKYIMMVFTNKLNGYRVQTLRKSGAPLTGDYTLSYLSVNSLDPLTKPFAKNTDDIRFNSPVLSINNVRPSDLVSTLNGVLPKDILKNTDGSFSFKSKTTPSNTSYFGVEFKINDNINKSGSEKDILKFVNGINSLRLFCVEAPASQMEYVQYSLNGSSIPVDRPQWGVESKYPLPYYNAQLKMEIKLGASISTFNFPKRNLRDWKPIVGKDALMIQYKPAVIRDGGLIANNQALYEENENWVLKITSLDLTLSNSDLGISKSYTFSDYPYVDVLYKAIKSDMATGGIFQDFIIELLNTGTISSYESGVKYTRMSNELLECELKLVDVYPYTGYASGSNRTAYDAWKCFIPYAVDDSWHTFELMTKQNSNELFFMLDGKPASLPNTGYSSIGRLGIVNADVSLGGDGFLNCSFKDLEYYNGHTNGYEGYRKAGEEHLMFIASKKNPRILGIMWHDIMFSDVVGRPTVWMDVPKHLRTPFDRQVNYTHAGAAIILYRAYDDFKEEPVDLGGGRYSVVCRTGETLAGVGTFAGGTLTQIKVDTLVSGVWSTSPAGMEFWQGMINRVGNDVLISTAFLEQCFQQCKEKGYEIITWQDVLEILKGNKKTSIKYFAPQFDDWALYIFTDNDIRRLFNKYNAKISVALELNHVCESDGTIKPAPTKVALEMQRNGHENVLHQHYNLRRVLEYIFGVLSDEAERGLIEAIYKAGEVGVTMNIHDQSANQSTPNSMKLMEYLGMELSISTQNKSTTRATPRMYASRSGLHPRYATWGTVIE